MNHRPRLYLLLFWALAGAFLTHLAVPVGLLSRIISVKEDQRLLLSAQRYQSVDQVMIFSKNSFDRHFNRPEKELELNGTRYDVVSYTQTGDKVVCCVLPDERETKLIQTLNKYNGAKEKGDLKVRFWFPLFFQAFREHTTQLFPVRIKAFYCLLPQTSHSHEALDVVAPPPDSLI